jgi:hypothetical protein
MAEDGAAADLTDRVRGYLAPLGIVEKKMFGGVCFLLDGHMVGGTLKGELIVRVGKDAHAACLARDHARAMDITGRPMLGFIIVAKAGIAGDAGLRAWIDRAVAYARALPPKAVGGGAEMKTNRRKRRRRAS